jgi:hypothetical protein
MQAILVRIAIDQTFGHWNAAVDPVSGDWLYVPIPEAVGAEMRPGLGHRYPEFEPARQAFCERHGVELRWPAELAERWVHLDPDFSTLTYGDRGARRGKGIRELSAGDLLVFYAGLRPITTCADKLVYAIVGLYVIEEILLATEVEPARRGENAHTRRAQIDPHDIVVRARPGVSGRLSRCVPIGEFRNGAYRVRRDLIEAWGGLSVKDGYLQRSGVPPRFHDPERFADWFRQETAARAATLVRGLS